MGRQPGGSNPKSAGGCEAGLEQGNPVDLRYEDGELRIRKRARKRYDLDEMLASVPDDFDEGEWDIGPPVGNEVW